MNKKRLRMISITLVFFMLFSITSAFAEGKTEAGETIDTIINYDVKTRVAKDVYNSIKEDKAAGKDIDWKKIKEKVVRKPIMAQAGLDIGAQILGSAVQYSIMGLFPPYGIIAGSIANSVMGSLGGGLGYEVSKNIEEGRKMNALETVGTALKNIDAATFFGRSTGSVIGAVIGTAICPIPFLGTVIGGMAGTFVGGLLTTQMKKVGIFNKFFDKVQEKWNAGGDFLIKKGKEKAIRDQQKQGQNAVVVNNSTSSITTAVNPAINSVRNNEVVKKAYDKYMTLHQKYVSLMKEKMPDKGKINSTLNSLNNARKEYTNLIMKK